MHFSEKYRKKSWMPAVMSHLKQTGDALTYDEIIDNTVMLSVKPKKTLRQTHRCPSKKGFYNVMCHIEEVETWKEGQFRYWRFIDYRVVL